MELGLTCSACGHLNPLRAQKCEQCRTSLAPKAGGQARAVPPPPSISTFGKGMPAAKPPQPGTTPRPPQFDAKTGKPLGAGPSGPAKKGFTGSKGGAAKTMFFGALQQQAVVPRLVVIKGEGGDGLTFHLSGTNHTVGRSKGDILFREDPFLDPEHAKFTVQGGRLFVKGLESTNGIFVRIKSPVPLDHDDCFLVGEQLLRIDSKELPTGEPDQFGTYAYSSPRPDGQFRVIQLLAGGGEGRVISAQGGSMTMGREGNIMNFPSDRFISGRHARLDAASDSEHIYLTDTGSRNGTFVRLKGAQELFHGDYLFVGQQLFRVEIS